MKPKNQKKITHVKISFNDKNTINFDMHEELTPRSCISAIKSQPLVFWYTNGKFVTKKSNLVVNFNTDLTNEVDEKSNLELDFQEMEYTLELALSHIQQTARIIFTLSQHPEVTDCGQSVVAWMTRTYSNIKSGKKIPTEQDYLDYYPANFLKSYVPDLVKHFDILEDSLPSKDGIFIKIKIITEENEELIIDSTKDGFSIENKDPSTTYSTLYKLLFENSEFFRDNSEIIANRWMLLDKKEKNPYIPLNTEHIYSNKTKPQLRIFNVNKEILTGSVEDEINKINTKTNTQNDDQLKYVKTCINIEEQYMKQLSESVKKIDAGLIQPESSENDKVYVDNGVRITKIDDINEYRSLSNYVKHIDDLKNISEYIKVERPVIIEYLGQLYAVKPRAGEENFISHFSGEGDEKNFKKDFCEKFFCKDVPNGIQGFSREMVLDGDRHLNCAMLTYVPRVSPRDANYPNDSLCLLRPELLRNYEDHVQLEKHSEELVQLGGDPKFEYSHDPDDKAFSDEQYVRLNERRLEIINEKEPIIFDLNLTNDQVKSDKLLNDIAGFIQNLMLSKFANVYLTTANCPIDGSFIVQKLHTCGINVRYIGKLLKFLPIDVEDENIMSKTFTKVIESEMIIRSFKFIVRTNNYNIDTLLEKINTILHFDSDEKFGPLFESICKVSQKKFETVPKKPERDQIGYLKRGLMIAFGIVVGIQPNQKEDDQITRDKVVQVVPHVKFRLTKNKEYNDTLTLAFQAFNSNHIKDSYQFYQKAIRLSTASVPQFDETIIDSYFYCSLIFYRAKKLADSYNMMKEAIIMEERHVGFTNTSLVFKYRMLGEIATEMGNKRLAFVLLARSFTLLKLIAPLDPFLIDLAADAAGVAAEFDSQTALKFVEYEINACKSTLPPNQIKPGLGTAYVTAAGIALATGKLPLASKFADEAIKLDGSNEEFKNLKRNIENQRNSNIRGRGRRGRH